MTKQRILSFAGAIFLIMAGAFITRTTAQRDDEAGIPANAERWEYLVVSGSSNVNFSQSSSSSMRKEPNAGFAREGFVFEQNLDKLGAKGWELVSIQEGRDRETAYYFKRRK